MWEGTAQTVISHNRGLGRRCRPHGEGETEDELCLLGSHRQCNMHNRSTELDGVASEACWVMATGPPFPVGGVTKQAHHFGVHLFHGP